MTPQVASLTLQFLARADLKGGEVPAFNSCIEALQGLVNVSGAKSSAGKTEIKTLTDETEVPA